MSIITAFDNQSLEIINPKLVVKRDENFPQTVIVVWARNFMEKMKKTNNLEQICLMTAGVVVPIYCLSYKNHKLGFYLSPIGGPVTVGLLEEIIAKGAKNILFFGSCGCLNSEIVSGHLIIPTKAYRDEGTSYHYAPASDYIEVKTANKLASIFDELGVTYNKGKIWTTDALYRETVNNMNARKKDGCVAVDMECASVMACGDFRGVNVYEFVFGADCLDSKTWDKRILENMPHDMEEAILKIALETAIRL